MTLKIKFLLRTTSILMGAPLIASSAYAQSVQDAVQAAIAYHPQIEQAEARAGGAQEEISSVRSGFFPSLSVGLTGGRTFADNATSRGLVTTRGAAYSGLGEVSASLQQPIFDGFETISRLKASRSTMKSANFELQDVKGQITFQTVQAYLNVLEAQAILRRVQNQEAKVNDYLARIKTNVEDGGADESQLQQAEDVRVLLNGFVVDYTGQLKNAESEFISLTGTSPFVDMEVPNLDLTTIPLSVDDALAATTLDHPAVRAMTHEAKAADFDVDAEKALLYPEVFGELSYLKNDKKEEIGGELEDRRAVLRLNWDFETGGGQYARIKQRKYEHAEAKAREKEIKNQIQQEIRSAYAEHEVAQKRLTNQGERVALNQKLFDTYEAQFEGGRVDLLQLMQADNQLFTAKIEKAVFQFRFLAAQYGVLASIGQIHNALFQNTANASPHTGVIVQDQIKQPKVNADEPQE